MCNKEGGTARSRREKHTAPPRGKPDVTHFLGESITRQAPSYQLTLPTLARTQ
jgi:hypothetical protein